MTVFCRALVVCSILVCPAMAAAFDTDTNTVVYREKLKEKLVCDSTTCTEVQLGGYSMAARWQLDPGVIETFDGNTSFILGLNGTFYQSELRKDPNYQVGDTKATLRSFYVDVNGRSKAVITVKLSWKDGDFRARVKGVTAVHLPSPVAAGMIGSTPGPQSLNMEFYMAVQSTFTPNLHLFFPLTGDLKRTTRTVDSGTYELDSVKLAGVRLPGS